MEMTHCLHQFSDQCCVVKPKKEVNTQSGNHGIFLQFRLIFVNCCPMRLELVPLLWGLISIFVCVMISDSSQ